MICAPLLIEKQDPAASPCPERQPRSPEQSRTTGQSFTRQLSRLLCGGPGQKAPRSRRDTASAPAADVKGQTPSGSETPGSAYRRDRQLSDLQRMARLPSHTRRRRPRISSEYYSSSDAYTPLYPSPIGFFYTPRFLSGPGGQRVHSRSDTPFSTTAEGDPSWRRRTGHFRTEEEGDEDDASSAAEQHAGLWPPHHRRSDAGGSRSHRTEKRSSRSRLTEMSTVDDEVSVEDRDGSRASTRVGVSISAGDWDSCSPETSTESRHGRVGGGGRRWVERRILRRNSTGTVQVMDMGSIGSGASGERSGS